MNTNDLYIEYARCIEMCKGTALENQPWKCVKWNSDQNIFAPHVMSNDTNPDEYSFAVAILEDKPVWVGDILYDKMFLKDNTHTGYEITGCECNELTFKGGMTGKVFWETWQDDAAWQPPEPKVEQFSEIKIISELTSLANNNSLDTQCNMPDFIIGAYLYKSLQALMEANKANGEYFKLSAQEDEAKTQ